MTLLLSSCMNKTIIFLSLIFPIYKMRRLDWKIHMYGYLTTICGNQPIAKSYAYS